MRLFTYNANLVFFCLVYILVLQPGRKIKIIKSNDEIKYSLIQSQDNSNIDSNLFEAIPEEYFVENSNDKTVLNHLIRINEEQKLQNKPPPNYVEKFTYKVIDFETYLIKQHQNRIEKTARMLLFKNLKIYSEVYPNIRNRLNSTQLLEDINHEIEHFRKAKENSIEAYYGIKVNIDSISDSIYLTAKGSVVAFEEKKAYEENWTLRKYINVCKDVATVSKMSHSDSVTMKTLENLEIIYREHDCA